MKTVFTVLCYSSFHVVAKISEEDYGSSLVIFCTICSTYPLNNPDAEQQISEECLHHTPYISHSCSACCLIFASTLWPLQLYLCTEILQAKDTSLISLLDKCAGPHQFRDMAGGACRHVSCSVYVEKGQSSVLLQFSSGIYICSLAEHFQQQFNKASLPCSYTCQYSTYCGRSLLVAELLVLTSRQVVSGNAYIHCLCAQSTKPRVVTIWWNVSGLWVEITTGFEKYVQNK